MVKLPYFDYLFALLESGDPILEASFGKHVHWGYWHNPETAELTLDDFNDATEALSAEICKAGKIQNGDCILDAGCGFGGTVAHINDKYSNMKLIGLNIDERQLLRAHDIVKPVNSNQVLFQLGNACELPFPDHYFDSVLAVECIFHFPSRKHFFEEAYRVLKPGGYLALSDFIPSRIIEPFTRIKLPEKFSTGFYGNCNLQQTTMLYRKLAQETNFDLLIERDITTNTLPTYDYLRKLRHLKSSAPKMALLETAIIEILSRLHLMKYFIYAFQKNDKPPSPISD